MISESMLEDRRAEGGAPPGSGSLSTGFEGDMNGAAGADDEPIDSMHLWPGDAGTLPYDARSSLLRLVKGPFISETGDETLWRALLNYTDDIRSRLADLFLELCIDAEAGVAFAKNVSAEDRAFPKAAASYTMTLLDTVMVLLLRKELQTAGGTRVFIGKAELFAQMMQYRAIDKTDEAAYLKKLESSWTRLADRRLLMRSDVEGRFEISPVLKLVFGAEEARAVLDEYENLKRQAAGAQASAPDNEGNAKEATLFDGLA